MTRNTINKNDVTYETSVPSGKYIKIYYYYGEVHTYR